jgi:hypothetical protein
MNELMKLEEAIRTELPAADVSVDQNVLRPQYGWLDIQYAGRSIAVEWRAGKGFGVSLLPEHPSSPSEGLFEGPDEVLSDWVTARDHILLLLDDATSRRYPRRVANA